MPGNLQNDYQYYLDHQRDLSDKYVGKVLVIKNQEIIGVYTSEVDAINETKRSHPIGSFLVQRCETPEASVPQIYRSRAAFR